jgi:hypothetical protein
MKKQTFIVFLLCSSTLIRIHALQESYLTFEFSFKDCIAVDGDSIHSPGSNKGMLGTSITSFGFWDGRDIGTFALYNTLIPLYVTNLKSASNIDSYRSNISHEGAIGVGFRRIFTNRLTFLGGLGIDCVIDTIHIEFENNDKYSTTMLNFGVLGSGGLKFDITNRIFLNIGVHASYLFVTYTTNPSEWMLKSSIAVNPFIGVGLNLFNYGHLGKP